LARLGRNEARHFLKCAEKPSVYGLILRNHRMETAKPFSLRAMLCPMLIDK
jgi:hypothetical protein